MSFVGMRVPFFGDARRSRAAFQAVVAAQGFNQYTNAVTTYQNLGNTPWLHMNNPFPNGLIQAAGSSLGLMNDVGFGANGPRHTAAAR